MGTWIVGDVHGCADELSELLARIGPGSGDAVVLVGDLFDKGPAPAGVLRVMDEVSAAAVLGNHDVLVRDHGRARLGRAPRPAWSTGYLEACLEALERAGELERAVDLCGRLPLFLRPLPGWTVVHGGLHPREGVAGTDEKLATTVRDFPKGQPGATRWWRQWRGPDAVVFGHDARQGLVDHRRDDGAPLCVGLDTGCVYGGALTAYSPEEDRFVQVPARRAWHPTDAD